MMTIRHQAGWFTTKEQALAEAAGDGMHAFVSEDDAYELGPHWHAFSAHLYLLDGGLHMTDCATGQEFDCRAGGKVIIPARCLHKEKTIGMTYVLALTVDPATLRGEINRAPAELHG